MKLSDAFWLVFVAACLSAGIVGGSYLKKDELLPICHSLAPGLFAPVSVTLAIDGGVFDSTLDHTGRGYQVTFVGPDCTDACQAHVVQARDYAADSGLAHLWVAASGFIPSAGDIVSRGIDIGSIQAAESFGLTEQTWRQPGYVATWVLNPNHHIDARYVNRSDSWGR